MGCSNSTAAEPAQSSAPGAPVPAAPGGGNLQEDLKSDDPEVRPAKQAIAAEGLGAYPEALSPGPEAESRLRKLYQLPADWDLQAFCNGKRLKGGLGGRKASTVVAFQPQPPEVVKAMQSVLDGTYRKVYTRDRRGAPIPDRFVVKDVHRVLNDQVWREYCDTREQIRSKLNGEKPSLPDGSHTVNVLQKGGLGALPPLDSEVNEHWLFHGTTAEAATGIAENDFRLDLSGSNAGTLYGKGIYLAENATKSDEYGEGPKGTWLIVESLIEPILDLDPSRSAQVVIAAGVALEKQWPHGTATLLVENVIPQNRADMRKIEKILEAMV
ncbi:TCDD-inducible poly [ADP-ribose] polymerase [Symbiodinium microadriaticum]|uniref:TCDD-inducible poly [ADP-ribose] polymerase n=1 Tax=Symbiodinium microadriaticum TaxID=2951 RepID=A0A1Q9ENN2_SYMMI|nr:TCDD-inducible poly [ADP-ribose] polymerase [Symbiodinium microadriaticum]